MTSFQAELGRIASAPCVLRRESFGCIIYRRDSHDYIPCDRQALEILLFCRNKGGKVNYEELPAALRSQVSNVSYDQFMNLCASIEVVKDGCFNGYILDNAFVGSHNHLSAPTSIDLQLTRYCNLKCEYCLYDAGLPQDRELTMSELDGLFSQLCSLGVYIVNIVGGEPLGRKDFPDVIGMANKYGLCVNVATNAALATKIMEERLTGLSINSFKISLDAGSEKIYDNIRGVRSYRKVMRGIGHLRAACPQAKVYFHVNVFRDNCSEIPSIVKKAEEHGVDKLIFDLVLPVGRASKAIKQVLNQDEAKKTIKIIDNIAQSNPLHIEVNALVPPLRPVRRAFEGLGCECGRTELFISSNGLIYPSILLSSFPAWKVGDIRKNKLFDIWNRSAVLESWRSEAVSRKCRSCPKVGFCRGGCRARTLILTKDLKGKDPFCNYTEKAPETSHT